MRSPLLALGVWLAARGPLALAGFVLAALCAIGLSGAAFAVAPETAARWPAVASSVVAWSAGTTLVFGAALRAVHRDREEGVLALVRLRGARLGGYVRGRVGGLVLVVAAAVGAATLVASAASIVAAHGSWTAVRQSAAAVVYALAFAAVLCPVAMATLGVRSRAGGYVAFVLVLVVPELLASWTESLLPRDWDELTSLSAALAAVRAGVAHPIATGEHAVRAIAALAAVVALALLVVAARARTREV